MVYVVFFLLSAIIAVGSASFIFKTSKMTHAMLGFAILSTAIAVAMMILNLPLLALLQLFIMIGGVSTYLFVGASSENLSKFKHTNLVLLVLLSIVIAIPLIYEIAIPSSASGSNLLTNTALTSSISSNLSLFYLIALLLFGVGLSSIIMMKNLKGSK